MKVFKKIGLGFISLGLISTFYIPEAKAGNRTLYKFTVPDEFPLSRGRTYVIKLVTNFSFSGDKQTGQYLLKKVGSGKTDCEQFVYSDSTFVSFLNCVQSKLGPGPFENLTLEKELNW